MVSAGVNPVPEHSYGREVVSDAGVVLNMVEPSRHIHIQLLLLDGQVHLGERGGGEVETGKSILKSKMLFTMNEGRLWTLIFYVIK